MGKCVCFQQDILSFLIVQISLKVRKQRVETLKELSTVIDHIGVAGISGNSWAGTRAESSSRFSCMHVVRRTWRPL
jgi:hypothetical protein